MFLSGKSHDDKTKIEMKSWQCTQDMRVEVDRLFEMPYKSVYCF